jgi:hypothetical protein
LQPFIFGNQRVYPLASLMVKTLPALPGVQVGDLRLGYTQKRRNLALFKAGIHQKLYFACPHKPNDSIHYRLWQEKFHAGDSVCLSVELHEDDSVSGMKQDDIRSKRLRKWIDEDPVSNGNVVAWCNHYSHYTQEGEEPLNPVMIRGMAPKRGKRSQTFGEKIARKLEEIGRRAGYWRGENWLDSLEDPVPRGIVISIDENLLSAALQQIGEAFRDKGMQIDLSRDYAMIAAQASAWLKNQRVDIRQNADVSKVTSTRGTIHILP